MNENSKINSLSKIEVDKDSFLVFRGESKDYEKTALTPGIYRENYIKHEDVIYREMQRLTLISTQKLIKLVVI
jgi:hypothetical protein